ncbi:hemolytic domain containing protein [Nitzschia inconspicua]|uniref:Hemolytic domain containing protein n=1 Tax=Nitzschia inconspicua TaxID=303405 RepID=A0A9K3K5D5_9STRA|nr:hemolytic domain containing protein [Nitzschia inconspicua]
MLLSTYLTTIQQQIVRPNAKTSINVIRVSFAVAIAVGGVGVVRYHVMSRTNPLQRMGLLMSSDTENNNRDETTDQDGETTTKEPSEVSVAMIGAIGFYKNFISPLLPPACRFVPTCSQYGVQAIQEFGPTKGAILTTWRLLRCSPLGGKGYDPPKWPPVPYTYSSY